MKQPNAHFTLLVFALLLAGCANIAERGATLSGSVSEGVERMQANQARLIHALADVQRGVLDERWEAIYARAERRYREREGLAPEETLSRDDRLNIATIAAASRQELRQAIAEKERALLQQSRANAKAVLAMNRTVQDYLLSLQKIEKARQQLIGLGEDVTGLEVEGLPERVRSRLEELTRSNGDGG